VSPGYGTYSKVRMAISEAKRVDGIVAADQKAFADGRNDPRFLPWMPFSWPEFIAMIAEAVPELGGHRFLDVGAGIGTRMLLAREIFGLDVHGIERVEAYASVAGDQLGLTVDVTDALDYKGYGGFDLIWINRPVRDRELERQLESKIWSDMAPGAVVAFANIEAPPPNWYLIFDDWEVRRGIWQKPGAL
jgi:predicted O-methyltransferase YrrM